MNFPSTQQIIQDLARMSPQYEWFTHGVEIIHTPWGAIAYAEVLCWHVREPFWAGVLIICEGNAHRYDQMLEEMRIRAEFTIAQWQRENGLATLH